eukprot:g65339.t1
MFEKGNRWRHIMQKSKLKEATLSIGGRPFTDTVRHLDFCQRILGTKQETNRHVGANLGSRMGKETLTTVHIWVPKNKVLQLWLAVQYSLR